MPTALTEIRNIGPAFAEALTRAGIRDAEALRDLGADIRGTASLADHQPLE